MPSPVPDDAFARYVNQIGNATLEQIEAAKAVQAENATKGITLSLGEVLVQQGILTAAIRENVEKKLQAQATGGIQQLGNYKLLKKLGEGGMGAVYLAEDTMLARKVAVKVLPKRFTENPEFLARFRREARAAGRLNHPNIVGAFAVDEEQGHHYYVMEYCEGEPLDALLKHQKVLPEDQVIGIAIQVAQGLGYAHGHNFIHRDIKPANIFLTREGVAKILDLGLSKNVADAEQSFQTVSGTALGTPHYISPEQAQGVKNIDGRTDMYSLGATLYHLLTGQTPFNASTAAAIMLKHISEQLPDPRDLRPDLSEGIVHIIAKAMAKAPENRYANMGELLVDLEQAKSGQAPSSAALDAGLSSIAMRRTATLPPPAGVAQAPSPARPLPHAGEGRDERAARVRGEGAGVRRTGPRAPVERDAASDRRAGRDQRAEDAAAHAAPGSTKRMYAIIGGVVAAALLVLGLILAFSGGDKRAAAAKAKPEQGHQPASPSTQPPTREQLAKAAPEVQAGELRAGLMGEYFELATRVQEFPTLAGVQPCLTRVDGQVNFQSTQGPFRGTTLSQHFCVRWKGLLRVPADGRFTFFLESDDGAKLYVDGKLAVDNGGLHAIEEKSGSVNLTSGLHDFRVEYYQNEGSAGCIARWQGADLAKEVIPASALFHPVAAATAQPQTALTGPGTGPVGDTWIKRVQALSAEKQVEEVRGKLKELNPDFDGKLEAKFSNGQVVDMAFVTDAITDISALRCLSSLKGLKCSGSGNRKGRLSDLGPLAELRLEVLDCRDTQIADLKALSNMPLRNLLMGRTNVSDLGPLRNLPLEGLLFWMTPVRDLSPLRNLPLTDIHCDEELLAQNNNRDVLRSVKTLRKIQTMPAEEYWRKYPERQKVAETPAATQQPRQTVDLLAITDPVKDRVTVTAGKSQSKANAWERRGAGLAYLSDGGSGKVAPPVAIRARSFEIEADFERLAGTGRFHVDLPLDGGRIVPLCFDSPALKMINARAGEPWPANRGTRARVVARLDCGTGGAQDRITVRLDGALVVDWQGDVAKMAQTGEPHPEFPGQPVTSLYSHTGSYEVRSWQLRIFDGEATVLRGSAAATQEGAAGVDAPARWKDAVNLLALVDVQKDTMIGKWELAAGTLSATDMATRFQKMQPPYHPPAEYDYHVCFTVKQGNGNVAIALSAAGRSFILYMKRYANDYAFGFEAINGKAVRGGPTDTHIPFLEHGRRYSATVQVRKDGLKAYLDGKLLTSYQTDYHDMGPFVQFWKFRDDSALGLGCEASLLECHTARVLEITGKGEFTRPDDPAAKEARKKQDEVWSARGKSGAAQPDAGALPKELSLDLGGGVKMEFVLVPAGEFDMGSTDERRAPEMPIHKVKISKPYYLGKYEVTVRQFRAFVETMKYQTEGEKAGNKGTVWDNGWRNVVGVNWAKPGFPQDDNQPVCLVSWNDAQEFCKWASNAPQAARLRRSVRLPTEAEWEHACRAGTTTRYYTGGQEGDLDKAAWFSGNSGMKTRPVGQKLPNAWGLYDVHGNVWEWCQDFFGDKYYADSPLADPKGPATGLERVMRGGTWDGGPVHCYSARRHRALPDYAQTNHGFRCAVDVTGTATAPSTQSTKP